MFERLAGVVIRYRWWVIVAWAVVAGAPAALAPSLDQVTSGDQGSFIPDSYESVQAQQLAEEAFPEQTATGALLVFTRADGGALTAADQTEVVEVTGQLADAGIPRVAGAATNPEAASPDGRIRLAQVAIDGEISDSAVTGSVAALREWLAAALDGTDVTVGVTGEPAMLYDSEEALRDGERIVGIVTVALVIGLLLLIFRSPVAALLPVLAVAVVLTTVTAVIASVYSALDVQTDQNLPILLTVVLYGIGTDYTLFLLFRYRERLRAGDEPRRALVTAVGRIGGVVLTAASVVIIAFLALLIASLGLFTTLGPGMAIGVAGMALAVMTLIPAVVAVTGPRVFWPSRPLRPAARRAGPGRTVAERLGATIARRPALAASGVGMLLVGLATAALAYTPTYDLLDQLPGDTESVRAFEDLQEGFPAGALDPTQVYVHRDDGTPLSEPALAGVTEALAATEGVDSVAPAVLGADGRTARIDVVLAEPPLSISALDMVAGPLREAAHEAAPAGATVLVGGTTSAFADLRDGFDRDLQLIVPVAALLIALVLALLVRSLVAPWYLMLAVMTTFVASLGVGVLAVQVIGGGHGVIFIVPMMLYLFVIAIGTDYNILMVARLREEARAGATPRQAVARAVRHAGPAVAAAALILAGTFGALLSSGVGFLVQLGLTVAIGIVLAALGALFVVPALTALIGRAAWWPGCAVPARNHRGTGRRVGRQPTGGGGSPLVTTAV